MQPSEMLSLSKARAVVLAMQREVYAKDHSEWMNSEAGHSLPISMFYS